MNNYALACIFILCLCMTAIQADCKAKCYYGDDEPEGHIINGECICGHKWNNPIKMGTGRGKSIIDKEKKSFLYELHE